MTDLPDAPRTRQQQFQFLRDAHAGPEVWFQRCLSLTRQAPGLPGGIPSALAAAHIVPASDRVHEVADFRRGMSLFFDDPEDDNPFAHVATIAGWHRGRVTGNLDDVLTWTSDAARRGGVDLVRASFFPANWGDPVLFASTSLNGFDLPGYGTAPPDAPAMKLPTLRETLDAAEAAIRRGIRAQVAKDHPRKAAALRRDLAELLDSRKLIGG